MNRERLQCVRYINRTSVAYTVGDGQSQRRHLKMEAILTSHTRVLAMRACQSKICLSIAYNIHTKRWRLLTVFIQPFITLA